MNSFSASKVWIEEEKALSQRFLGLQDSKQLRWIESFRPKKVGFGLFLPRFKLFQLPKSFKKVLYFWEIGTAKHCYSLWNFYWLLLIWSSETIISSETFIKAWSFGPVKVSFSVEYQSTISLLSHLSTQYSIYVAFGFKKLSKYCVNMPTFIPCETFVPYETLINIPHLRYCETLITSDTFIYFWVGGPVKLLFQWNYY